MGRSSSSKHYGVGEKPGFETTTFDLDGSVVRGEPSKHVTDEEAPIRPGRISGPIQQAPSIVRRPTKDGIKLYRKAQLDATVDDVDIEAREAKIYRFDGDTCSDPKSPQRRMQSASQVLALTLSAGSPHSRHWLPVGDGRGHRLPGTDPTRSVSN
jgi:tRNA U55 pseudouridine synthase TruB